MHKVEKYLRVTTTTRHTLDFFQRSEGHLHNLKLISPMFVRWRTFGFIFDRQFFFCNFLRVRTHVFLTE